MLQLLKKFNWSDIGERSVKTFIEIFIAIAGVDTLSGGFIDDELTPIMKYAFIIITSIVGTILCTAINIGKHILSERLSKKYNIDIDLDTGNIIDEDDENLSDEEYISDEIGEM